MEYVDWPAVVGDAFSIAGLHPIANPLRDAHDRVFLMDEQWQRQLITAVDDEAGLVRDIIFEIRHGIAVFFKISTGSGFKRERLNLQSAREPAAAALHSSGAIYCQLNPSWGSVFLLLSCHRDERNEHQHSFNHFFTLFLPALAEEEESESPPPPAFGLSVRRVSDNRVEVEDGISINGHFFSLS